MHPNHYYVFRIFTYGFFQYLFEQRIRYDRMDFYIIR